MGGKSRRLPWAELEGWGLSSAPPPIRHALLRVWPPVSCPRARQIPTPCYSYTVVFVGPETATRPGFNQAGGM